MSPTLEYCPHGCGGTGWVLADGASVRCPDHGDGKDPVSISELLGAGAVRNSVGPGPKPDPLIDQAAADVKLWGDQRICPKCHGHGFTYHVELRQEAWKDIATRCDLCRGKGKVE